MEVVLGTVLRSSQGERETSDCFSLVREEKKFLRDYYQCSESFLNWYIFQETSLIMNWLQQGARHCVRNGYLEQRLHMWSLAQKKRFSNMPPGHDESVRVGRGWMKRTGQKYSQQWGEQVWRDRVQSRHSRNLPVLHAPRIQGSNLPPNTHFFLLEPPTAKKQSFS